MASVQSSLLPQPSLLSEQLYGNTHRDETRPPDETPLVIGILVKVRELIKLLEDDGWRQARMRGSHRQFRHAVKPGTVTVAGKPNVDIPLGTLNSILKQAGLKP